MTTSGPEARNPSACPRTCTRVAVYLAEPMAIGIQVDVPHLSGPTVESLMVKVRAVPFASLITESSTLVLFTMTPSASITRFPVMCFRSMT